MCLYASQMYANIILQLTWVPEKRLSLTEIVRACKKIERQLESASNWADTVGKTPPTNCALSNLGLLFFRCKFVQTRCWQDILQRFPKFFSKSFGSIALPQEMMKVQVSHKLSCWKCNQPCPIASVLNGKGFSHLQATVSYATGPRMPTRKILRHTNFSYQQDICPWWKILSVSSVYGFFNM